MVDRHLVVVSGASRGIGRGIVQAYAEQLTSNAELFISFVFIGRNGEEMEKLAYELQKDYGDRLSILVIIVDLMEKKCIEKVEKEWIHSFKDIDKAILINNSGNLGIWHSNFSEFSEIEFQNYFHLNLISFCALTSSFIQQISHITLKDVCIIVNISSLWAIEPCAGFSLYCSGKAARDMLMKVIAKEQEGKGIKTLNYAPGPVDTLMQTEIRAFEGNKQVQDWAMESKAKGSLVCVNDTCRKLIKLLRENNFESGSHIDYYDI
jgi:sepiapterin reductase